MGQAHAQSERDEMEGKKKIEIEETLEEITSEGTAENILAFLDLLRIAMQIFITISG